MTGTYLQICSPTLYHCASDCSCQTTAKLCNLCEEHVNVIDTVADPDPNPTIGGQLRNPNECNSTLTSETMGGTLTLNPNECNSTLTSGTRWGRNLYHVNWGGGQLPNPDECNSTLTSGTRGETLTPNPNECYSTLTSAIRGIYPCPYIYV